MTSKTILLALSMAFLVGCQPSEQMIQTAIAQTQANIPTATHTTISPTETPLPTIALLPTTTATVLPTSTPDLGVIDIDPKKLLLQKVDLPASGKYFLPKGWSSPLTNAEIVSGWTVEEGQAYLADSGRVHGWYVDYLRGTNNALLPKEVYDNVVIYKTSEGARKITSDYGDREIEDGYTGIEAPQVGDISRAWKRVETNAGGGGKVWLMFDFSYRNIHHRLIIVGLEKEVSVDFAVELAKKLLYKASQVPLSDKVTFEP